MEWNGLISGHGYIVKNVFSLKKSDGSETHLIKMRNPFKSVDGKSSWSGKYGMQDTRNWTPELKNTVDFANIKPGEFFLTIDDFRQGFKYYTVTYMHS